MSTQKRMMVALVAMSLTSAACMQLETPLDGASDTYLEKWSGDSDPSNRNAIDPYNDPDLLEPDFERRFDALPRSGSAINKPWTDSYWPKNKGGISLRWQTNESHTYQSPGRDEVMAMSEAELAQLSPSEKYDLFVGNYEYALNYRITSGNRATESSWQGYCHGWTIASMHFDEPQPVTVVNPDGVRIPFGSSDVKALLTIFQGEVVRSTYSVAEIPFKKETRVMGSLCLSNEPTSPQCADTNPGSFHIAMANYLGIQQRAFGIDATTTYEKWNHPVFDYRTTLLERQRTNATGANAVAERLYIRSDVTYALEIEPAWNPMNDSPEYPQKTKAYHYTLELDAAGNIVGGEWLTALEGGRYMSLSEAITYLTELDENSDGRPDLDNEQVKNTIWQYFDFPDYVWYQDRGEFAEEFKMPAGKYDLMVNNPTTRRALYAYMARLKDLYEASTCGQRGTCP